MTTFILWNNQVSKDPVLSNSSLFRGNAVFETLLYEDGIIYFQERHFERLFMNARALLIEPFPSPDIFQEVLPVLREKAIKRARIKLILFPGEKGKLPNYFFQIQHLNFPGDATSPVSLGSVLHPIAIKEFRQIKTINYGPLEFQTAIIREKGFDEPLFLDTDGHLLETSIANIYAIKGETIYTPPLSTGLLPGTVRSVLMEHWNVLEKMIHISEVSQYDYFFLSGSVRELRLVTRIDDHHFSPDQHHWKFIQKEYDQLKQKYRQGEIR